jgi:hypothetical protein
MVHDVMHETMDERSPGSAVFSHYREPDVGRFDLGVDDGPIEGDGARWAAERSPGSAEPMAELLCEAVDRLGQVSALAAREPEDGTAFDRLEVLVHLYNASLEVRHALIALQPATHQRPG